MGRGIALLFHDRGTRRGEWSVSNRNEYQEYFLGLKAVGYIAKLQNLQSAVIFQ